jgi:hypothetical protein
VVRGRESSGRGFIGGATRFCGFQKTDTVAMPLLRQVRSVAVVGGVGGGLS